MLYLYARTIITPVKSAQIRLGEAPWARDGQLELTAFPPTEWNYAQSAVLGMARYSIY